MTRLLTYVELDVPDFADSSPEEIVTYRFAQPTDYLPNTIDAIPSIESVSFNPSTISLGENLGVRASLKVSFNDHKHIFDGEHANVAGHKQRMAERIDAERAKEPDAVFGPEVER